MRSGPSHSKIYVLRNCQVSSFTKKHRAPKLQPTWQLMNVLHCLILWMRWPHSLSLALFIVSSYITYLSLSKINYPKDFILNKACSGFEPEWPITAGTIYLVQRVNQEDYEHNASLCNMLFVRVWGFCYCYDTRENRSMVSAIKEIGMAVLKWNPDFWN